ncbi:MAG: histidinol phosphatase [Verrucomicrobiota bacterium]
MRILFLACAILLIFACPIPGETLLAEKNSPVQKLSAIERMKPAHLKAAHADALLYQEKRRTLVPFRGLHDYKAILHAHAEDSAHTGGTRPEMLADAKKAGVQVIMLTDHLRPPRDFIRDSWRGMHEGVLFIPGSEAKGFLVYPSDSIMDRMESPEAELIASVTASNGLIFLSHIEERPDHSMNGLTGMEIYNRHMDAKKDMAGLIAIALKMLSPAELAEFQENLRLYPDEVLGAQVTYLDGYLSKWDAETQTRRLTGVAANDCHHNQVFVVKMVDERTVRFGTIVDNEDDMRKATADSRSGILEMTKGRKPGDELARVDLDPYYRSFRNSATHILATELSEPAIRSALQQGRAYVSHDWMCDATGFSYEMTGSAEVLMGDEAKFAPGQKLSANFPVACHIRLLKNGKVIAERDGAHLEQVLEAAGVYRVEGWLKLDGEERPWIYSNPIYVR